MADDLAPSRFVKIKRYACIEFASFLLVCSVGMTATVYADFIIYQTCRQTLGSQHWDNCNLLHNDSNSQAAMDLKTLIQPHASYILLVQSLMEGISPALMALFLGPWSDKHGRKPVLIVSCSGYLLVYSSLSLLTNWNLNPWMYLLASIPVIITGGMAGSTLSIFCYISDVTTDDNRAMRLALFENSLAFGLIVGMFMGPRIFVGLGYPAVFLVAASFMSFAVVYIIFFITESVKIQGANKWSNPFNWSLLKELIQKAIMKRDGLNRGVLWYCIALLGSYAVAVNFSMNYGFLFASARLGWDAVTYSQYNVVSITIAIFGIALGLKAFKMMGFHDTSIAMIAAVSYFTAVMTAAFTYKSWHMYLASVFGIFGGIVMPSIRSILSRSVPGEDVGKAFSLTTAYEAMLPMAINPIFTLIYTKYMPPYYPSPAHILAAAITVLIMVLIIIIDRRLRRDQSSYQLIVSE